MILEFSINILNTDLSYNKSNCLSVWNSRLTKLKKSNIHAVSDRIVRFVILKANGLIISIIKCSRAGFQHRPSVQGFFSVWGLTSI